MTKPQSKSEAEKVYKRCPKIKPVGDFLVDFNKYNNERFEYILKSSKTLSRYSKEFVKYLNGNVLDIGCGKGPLQDYVKGEYYGVDICEECAKCVKNFKCMDATKEKLPFKDNFFDTVLILSILEHVENFTFMMEEARRVLKKGGVAIIIVPNPRNILYNGIIFKKFSLETDKISPHIHSFTEEDLRNLFLIAKMKPIRIDRVNNRLFGREIPEIRIFEFFAEGLIAIGKKQ